jgi:hypothetical protein
MDNRSKAHDFLFLKVFDGWGRRAFGSTTGKRDLFQDKFKCIQMHLAISFQLSAMSVSSGNTFTGKG